MMTTIRVKVGEVGEIICQSPLATHGYYKNPEATRRVVSRRLVLHRRSRLLR